MGLWVGAAMQKAEPHAAMIHTQAGAWSYCFLHINKHGLRYENEDITAQAGCVSKTMQPDKIGWSVYDDNFLEVLPKTLEKGGECFGIKLQESTKNHGTKKQKKMTLKMHLEKISVKSGLH